MGYRIVTSDDVTWPWKVKLVTTIRLERNISKTTWARDFKFGRRLCMGMPSRRTNNFPESGRGLGHVTPTIFGSTVGYPSDSLASSCICLPSCYPSLNHSQDHSKLDDYLFQNPFYLQRLMISFLNRTTRLLFIFLGIIPSVLILWSRAAHEACRLLVSSVHMMPLTPTVAIWIQL